MEYVQALIGQQIVSPSVFMDATWQTYVMISIAELFDKTFFVALVLALRFSKSTVFWGAFGALFLHTFLAAFAGYFMNRMLAKHVVDFAAAALYLVFAGLYFKDWYDADPDGNVMDGMEEAEEDLQKYGSVTEDAMEKGMEEAEEDLQ